jgi:hypothetical protein
MPSRNWAWVHTEAIVVNSLIVACTGDLLPITEMSAMAGLSPLAWCTVGIPPLATRYRMPSELLGRSKVKANRPSSPLWARPNCSGASALAAQSVTVDRTIGAPPPKT